MGEIGWPIIIVFIFVLVGIFFLCRELFCWFWKINRRVELLEKIAKQLGVEDVKKKNGGS